MPGYTNGVPGRGYGMGRGRGRGRGMGRGFGMRWGAAAPAYQAPAYSAADETSMLQQEATALRSSLEQIEKRIAQLQHESSE